MGTMERNFIKKLRQGKEIIEPGGKESWTGVII